MNTVDGNDIAGAVVGMAGVAVVGAMGMKTIEMMEGGPRRKRKSKRGKKRDTLGF